MACTSQRHEVEGALEVKTPRGRRCWGSLVRGHVLLLLQESTILPGAYRTSRNWSLGSQDSLQDWLFCGVFWLDTVHGVWEANASHRPLTIGSIVSVWWGWGHRHAGPSFWGSGAHASLCQCWVGLDLRLDLLFSMMFFFGTFWGPGARLGRMGTTASERQTVLREASSLGGIQTLNS